MNPEANSDVPAESVDANLPVAPTPETVEAAPAAAPTAPVVVAKPSVPRRVLEWFWGSQAMAAARSRTLGPNQQVLELVRGSDCSAYDCEFAALALQLGVKLVTMDSKLLGSFPEVAVPLPAV